jgi:hypothetical protein
VLSLWVHAALTVPALIGLTIGDSTDTLVRINPLTAAVGTIGSGLPWGFSNDSYALNPANSLYYHEAGSNRIVVNTRTGALVGDHDLSISLIGMA